MWPHFLSSPAGRRWIRHSQKDGGGRLTTFFSVPPFTEDLLEDVVQRIALICFRQKYFLLTRPPPSSPHLPSPPSLPPEPSEAKLSPPIIIDQELSVTRRRTLKADGRLFNAERRFQFGGGKLERVRVSVCVLYVLLVFQGMWVFYIYFGVIVFFLFFFSVENQRKSILKIFSGRVQLAVMLLDFRTTQTAWSANQNFWHAGELQVKCVSLF